MCQSGPKTHQLQSWTRLGLFINQARGRRQLRPIDTKGGSTGLSSDLPLLESLKLFPGHRKTTLFSQQPCSPFIQFVHSFFPSFIQPISLLYLCWMLGMQRGIGSVPALREHQAGTHQLPCSSLLLSLRHRSDPQEAPGQGPRAWAESQMRRHTRKPREKEIIR